MSGWVSIPLAALLVVGGLRWSWLAFQAWDEDYNAATPAAGLALAAQSTLGGAAVGLGVGLLALVALA